MDNVHKLPNAKISVPEPQAELIAFLETALAYAKSGEAVAGALAMVLQRPDGTYFWTVHDEKTGTSTDLHFGICRLKARYERAVDLDGNDSTA